MAVLREYDAAPSNIVLIQGGSIKTVWKIQTDKGVLCLKRLKQSYDKALFSVNAQIYIKNSGGNVPGIIPNKKGEAITANNDQLFVLYEWIDGHDLDFGNPADLRNALKGLARFHGFSKGYTPADESRTSSKLGKWPEQYGSMLSKLGVWMETARANIVQQNFSAYFNHTAAIIDIGKMALEEIKKSAYEELAAAGSNSIVLCHQDYGRGNALLSRKGVYILDLDGVTFDLPARDLRKIIGKTAENRNQWQMEMINEITGWYEESYPMNKKERKLLYIDLLFPHWYYGLVKNLFQAGKPVKASEIERIAKLELSKVPILKTLIKKE
ncbi:MAG: CotS family spore coat protein [Ruminiclostridium sp.]|nr:CotS family spore coat protein [Ruminiclostridium sp.]